MNTILPYMKQNIQEGTFYYVLGILILGNLMVVQKWQHLFLSKSTYTYMSQMSVSYIMGKLQPHFWVDWEMGAILFFFKRVTKLVIT